MTAELKDVRCASIRVDDLPKLADLRAHLEIRLAIAQGRAFFRWEEDSEEMQQVLVQRILPLAGAVLFTKRGEHWYRLGDRLPAFDVAIGEGPKCAALHQALLPLPVAGRRPGRNSPVSLSVRLVRDERGRPQPATALRCPLVALSGWAFRATSAELAGLLAAWTGCPHAGGTHAEVLVLGPADALPPLPGGARFWGTDLLIPLGFRADPDLPETALRRAARAGPDDLAVLDQEGFELIARNVFRQLDRGGVRLAWERAQSGRQDGGSSA